MPGPLFEGSFVLAVVTGYLLLLFGIGYLGERKFDALRARGLDRYVYVFSAGVYCTSWTFYGCIGNAAQYGPSFLALFIGPSVFALSWWTVLRKLVRFCRTHNVTSVPDLLSVRYGGTPWLGALATLFLVIGSVPYISLQLRAVAISYDTIAGSPGGGMAAAVDPMLLVALFLAAFALHVGLKLPTVARAFRERGVLRPLRADLRHTLAEPYREGTTAPLEPDAPTMSRRTLLATVGAASLGAGLMGAAQSIGGPLRSLGLLAPHGRDAGGGPNGFQINKTAESVGIKPSQIGLGWRLKLSGRSETELTRDDLLAMPQRTYDLPIACVEGWSTTQAWTGVRLRDLAKDAWTAARGFG